MHDALVFAVVALCACSSCVEAADPDARAAFAIDSSAGGASTDETAGPAVSVQPGVSPAPPTRFAVLLDLESTSGCSRGSGTSRSRSSMVLELTADGSASACLGRRETYRQRTVDGSSSYDSREQRGFTGSWSREGAELAFDLLPTNLSSCPDLHVAHSTDGVIYLPEVRSLRLRCRDASTGDSPIPLGALVCERSAPASDLASKLFVFGVTDGAPLFLSPGPGLHITRTTDDPWGRGNGNHLDVRESSEIVGPDAWTRAE